MNHMRAVYLWLLLLLGVLGCGLRSGHFCANGEESLNSSTYAGCLSIVHGFQTTNGSAFGNRENLLYVMIVCPDFGAAANNSAGSGIEGNPMTKPLIYHDWLGTGVKVHVAFSWDTRADTILIDGQSFNREQGNVFVIVRKTDGSLTGHQCGTLGPKADYSDAVHQIRQQMANDELIRRVKFYKVDQ